jgi:nucleoside-diphosphate-sugar epimerase
MNQTIVLTGSEGFIGGYIVQEALQQGYKVIGIDNFSKYGKVIRSFEGNSNYEFVLGDCRDTNLMSEIFKQADHVIAGAAMIGGISYFHKFAYDLLATNERIMASTCDAAIEARKFNKLKKMTYISSSMVYESTESWPSKEGDELKIAPPKSSYGFQKLAVEYFARAAWLQYKLPYTILRPFNCVGIGEVRAKNDVEIKSGNLNLALSHVVPDLIQKILKGQNPLHILGTGKQERCYTYGGDLAKGIVNSLNNPKALNEDFNLSSKEPINVIEIARLIWDKVNEGAGKLQFIHDKPYFYDVQKRIPDTNKARKILGFEANTKIENVLEELIPWIKGAIEKELI